MRRYLMASVAAVLLAVAAPLATAQYTTPPPATAPYTTPLPDNTEPPQDQSLSAQPDRTSTLSQSQTMTPGAPAMQDSATTSAQHTEYPTLQTQSDLRNATQTTAAAGQAIGSTTTLASLEEHARDAGMDGLPMTPTEVCAPREVELTASGARLNTQTRRQLINATDRASVCEFQRVVVVSPTGRADAVRQTLVAHGVDESLIDIQDGDAAGLEVEMHFSGLATSSEMYAQMFSPQQLASYQPSTAYSPSSSYQPSSSTMADPAVESETIWLGDPDVEIPDVPAEEGWTRTSNEPAVTPEMLDI